MARKNRKFRLNRKVWIEPEMMESEAFRSLSSKAMWVLLRFFQKRTWSEIRQGGRKITVYENSGLTFTYPEANHFGISDSQFYRSIKALIERGFLDPEHRGGSFGQGRDYSRFRLSERWRKWGTPDFEKKSFQRLLPKGLDVQSRKKSKGVKGILEER
jgi:hypothetical protein